MKRTERAAARIFEEKNKVVLAKLDNCMNVMSDVMKENIVTQERSREL